jgi:tRNA pseudouridine38-40 synthase
VDFELLQRAAELVKQTIDFTSFSKKNTQVKTFNCAIEKSDWMLENGCLVYEVKANRFLRGMVRSLVGTMLLVGRKKISVDEFSDIIRGRDCSLSDFSAPAQGLFLVAVEYPMNFFQ